MAQALDVAAVPTFDCKGDPTNLAQRWWGWKRGFQFYVTSKGLTDAEEKKALLRHCTDMETQDLYEALTDPGPGELCDGEEDNANEYDVALRTFDVHFNRQLNVPCERHVFRQMSQGNYESIDQFIARLHRQSGHCDFGNAAVQNIQEQVVEKCQNPCMHRKLLEQGHNLNLQRVQEICSAMEAVDIKTETMDDRAEVNSVKGTFANGNASQ